MSESKNYEQHNKPVLDFLTGESVWKSKTEDGDWPEDFGQENGNYTCKCEICGEIFMGDKHRVVCKKCAHEDITIKVIEYNRLCNIERKYEILNEWYWSRPK